jgi:hypothetical protein
VAPALAEPQASPFAGVKAWDWFEPVVFEAEPGVYDRERRPMSDVDRETFRAFADYANEDGVCFPAQATIASDLAVCLKTAQRRTRRLIEGGHMRIAERRWSPFSKHRHNVYELVSLDLCPVSPFAHRRVTRRAHATDPGRVERARRAIRRGLVGMGCPTKGTERARTRPRGCRCRACREDRRSLQARDRRLVRERVRQKWRPEGPEWRDELARRLRRAGRDPDMAYELPPFNEPPPRLWSQPTA